MVAEPAPIVEAQRLRKTYRNGPLVVEALRGLDLVISRGEMVAIMGPSGCGKTTLLYCLSGLDDFDSGEVILAGCSLRTMNDDRKTDFRARNTGFVFQSYNLLPVLNARENVELPLLLVGRPGGEARRRAMESLGAVGLTDRAEHRPSELSGGQQQRVAIARALVNEPAVIWADEPTGNLDSEATADLMDLLSGLVHERGQTLVVVTHARAVAERADRILRMRDGRIVGEESAARQEWYSPVLGPGSLAYGAAAQSRGLSDKIDS
jgi:ABC-type lipoprotein export system ATPase subunit